MTYHLMIYGNTVTPPAFTCLQPPNISIERFSKRINAPGKLVFSMKATHPEADPATLRLYRRVVLYRNGVKAWHGFIQETTQTEGVIEVICSGMLELFAKRATGDGEEFTHGGSDEAFGLLDDCNSDSDTGVTAGTGGVVGIKTLTSQGRTEVLRMWELLAQAHGAEFEIDDNGVFHFVPLLGSDKSGSVDLKYFRNGQPGTNLVSYQPGESGLEMANRVIGISTAGGGMTSTWNDAASQATYGLLTEVKQFNEAQDQATLDALAQAYGEQRSNPPTDLRVSPMGLVKRYNPITNQRDVTGLDYADVRVGDVVLLWSVTENEQVIEAKRIAEIVMELDAEGREQLGFTLSKPGVFVTAAYLDATRAQDLASRIKKLERTA